jgi:hypothetical protein
MICTTRKHGRSFAANRVRRRLAVLDPADIDLMGRKIDGAPIQGARLRNPQPMPVHDKDQSSIPRALPVAAGGLNKPDDLILGQMLARAIGDHVGSVCAPWEDVDLPHASSPASK